VTHLPTPEGWKAELAWTFVAGLVEVLWKRDCYSALLNAVLLAKCIHAHVWEKSHYVSKQLTGIGLMMRRISVLINSFEN